MGNAKDLYHQQYVLSFLLRCHPFEVVRNAEPQCHEPKPKKLPSQSSARRYRFGVYGFQTLFNDPRSLRHAKCLANAMTSNSLIQLLHILNATPSVFQWLHDMQERISTCLFNNLPRSKLMVAAFLGSHRFCLVWYLFLNMCTDSSLVGLAISNSSLI